MCRALRDTLILAGAPAIVALAVLMLGATLIRTSPADAATEPRMEQLWPVSACHTATVTAVRDAAVAGNALLCVAPDAVRPALYATGLTPGSSYSVWMLSVDRLRDGRSDALAGDALVGLDGVDAFGRLGSGVAPFDGMLHVQGHVEDRPLASGSQVTVLLVDDGTGGVSSRRLGAVIGYARFALP